MGDRNYGINKGRITAAVTHSTASRPKSLLGVWPTWTFGQRLPHFTRGSGKRHRARTGGDVRTLNSSSPAPPAPAVPETEGPRQHRRGSQDPLPPEADVIEASRTAVVVGRLGDGDSCYVPVAVEGVPCSALVDTGSSVTVLRPDVCPEWIRLEPTDVQLRTATGGLAPMKGTGLLTLTLGGNDVRHPVWIAAMQDPCILGCDFLKATGCRLDLDGGTVSFRGGPVIALLPTGSGSGPPVGSISPAVCAVEPEVSDPLPVSSVTFPMTYVPQAAQAQSRRLEGGARRRRP